MISNRNSNANAYDYVVFDMTTISPASVTPRFSGIWIWFVRHRIRENQRIISRGTLRVDAGIPGQRSRHLEQISQSGAKLVGPRLKTAIPAASMLLII